MLNLIHQSSKRGREIDELNISLGSKGSLPPVISTHDHDLGFIVHGIISSSRSLSHQITSQSLRLIRVTTETGTR